MITDLKLKKCLGDQKLIKAQKIQSQIIIF